MSKKTDYNPPANLLDRLPAPRTVTRGDKLKTLEEMIHRQPIEWRERHAKTLKAIDADIRASGRAQKGDAPARTGAPSNPNSSGEAGSSIPPKALERKIADSVTVAIDPLGSINLYAHGEMLICFTPDQAERAAHALTELAGDLRRDANARTWSKELVAATAE